MTDFAGGNDHISADFADHGEDRPSLFPSRVVLEVVRWAGW
jgi:hypothetical protein